MKKEQEEKKKAFQLAKHVFVFFFLDPSYFQNF